VAGDPVEGDLFVGRGEVIKQLEELWLTNGQLQSVALDSHRRMGKTSILKNLPNYLGNNIQVVLPKAATTSPAYGTKQSKTPLTSKPS